MTMLRIFGGRSVINRHSLGNETVGLAGGSSPGFADTGRGSQETGRCLAAIGPMRIKRSHSLLSLDEFVLCKMWKGFLEIIIHKNICLVNIILCTV